MSTQALDIKGLHVGYGDSLVLRDLSMSVGKGQMVALIGANGAGKTTLLRTVSGLLRPSGGEMYLYGTPIHRMVSHQVVESGFVQSPEGKQLFLEMSIRENLLVGAHSKRARADREKTLKE